MKTKKFKVMMKDGFFLYEWTGKFFIEKGFSTMDGYSVVYYDSKEDAEKIIRKIKKHDPESMVYVEETQQQNKMTRKK